ncbi:hypothetical protein J6590_051967 [Homalodisca vitripennis]|nr:hypothetical protein J6590_051967 [Homalodisca vitripennis]
MKPRNRATPSIRHAFSLYMYAMCYKVQCLRHRFGEYQCQYRDLDEYWCTAHSVTSRQRERTVTVHRRTATWDKSLRMCTRHEAVTSRVVSLAEC